MEPTKLAPLKRFNPKGLFSDATANSELDAFIVTLALIWNDFRDLNVFSFNLKQCKPKDTVTPSPHLGDYAGMENHIHRLQMALLVELVQLIHTKPHLFALPDYIQSVRNIPSKFRQNWVELVESIVKLKKPAKNPTVQYLINVRSNGTFHYDQTDSIEKGYHFHFSQQSDAFVSLGRNMEQTRFYFADGAVQGYADSLSAADHRQKVDEFREILNEGIRFLVEAYINQKKIRLESVD